MADPSWTDAIRDDFFDELGYALGLVALPQSLEYLFHPQNTSKYLLATTDENGRTYFTSWRLTNGKKGTDTDANGWIYFKYTDGGATGTLEAYNDSARSVLVATSGSVANSTSMTLTPETGYTLAGTVMHGAPGASFNFAGQLITPPAKRIDQLFDGTYVDDAQMKAEAIRQLTAMRAGYASARTAAQNLAAFVVRAKGKRILAAVSDQSALIQPNLRQRSGVVTEEPRGLLEDLRAAMDDNTGGSAEVKAAAATLAGAVADPGDWDGSSVTPTYGQRGYAGVVTGVCVKGLDSTAPEFALTFKPTDTRLAPNEGNDSIPMFGRLRIGAQYKDPERGIEALTINYLPTIANSTGTAVSTTATDWSVTGMTSDNSDGGKLWGRYESSDTTLRFYRSEQGRDDADTDELVAQKTISATATAFTSEENDSGLTVTGKTGAALADNDEFSVDFNPPSPDQPSSYFTITITESTEGGEWVKGFRRGAIGGQPWEPNTGASPNVVDGQIVAGLPLINAAVLGDRD
jgi:hypothetical protein